MLCNIHQEITQKIPESHPGWDSHLKLGSRPRTGPSLEALILESAGHDSASSLGVALFALTSALSRVVVGILSDKYQGYFTRFHWVTDSWPGTSDMSCDVFLDGFFWCKLSRWNTKKSQDFLGERIERTFSGCRESMMKKRMEVKEKELFSTCLNKSFHLFFRHVCSLTFGRLNTTQ